MYHFVKGKNGGYFQKVLDRLFDERVEYYSLRAEVAESADAYV